MGDALRKVDAYISPGGRTPGYGKDEYVDDLIALSSFIAWQDDNALFGGHTGKEAWQAMCRLLDVHPVKLRQSMKGAATPSDSKAGA